MSYSLTVEVKDGVAAVVASSSVPDGVYNIGGHIDGQREDLTAGRRSLDGHPGIVTTASVYKEV